MKQGVLSSTQLPGDHFSVGGGKRQWEERTELGHCYMKTGEFMDVGKSPRETGSTQAPEGVFH